MAPETAACWWCAATARPVRRRPMAGRRCSARSTTGARPSRRCGRSPTSSTAARIDGAPIDPLRLGAPLPRAYEWVDGSAFLNHVILVRKARGAQPPATLETDPLIYQGGSGDMLGPRDPIELHDPAWGLDYESEVCVILGDTPLGTAAADAARARPAGHARQRLHAAQPRARRARQGLRVLPEQAGDRVLAVRGDARRARGDRRLARRPAARPGPLDLQRGRDRRLRRRARDALLVLRPDRAHLPDPAVHGRDDPRQRHGVERRPGARRVVPGRAPDDRDHPVRAAERPRSWRSATGSGSRPTSPAQARSARSTSGWSPPAHRLPQPTQPTESKEHPHEARPP